MVHGDTLLVDEKDKCQADGKNLAIVSLFLIVLSYLGQRSPPQPSVSMVVFDIAKTGKT